MTVYPLVLDLGFMEVTGFGLMMMVGFLMAGWVMQRELRRRGLNEGYAWDIVVAAIIGGVVGAKVWYAVLHQSVDALFSRSGMVWFGGFIGGTLGVIINSWRVKVPVRFTAELTAPALAVGYALGRVGCFLVQDDYGIPTSLPWAMKFPEGLPPTSAQYLVGRFGVDVPEGTLPTEVLAVHPTQLYEVAIMLGAFAVLWRLRPHRHAVGWLFGLYLMLAGTERFLIEFIRAKDDRLLGAFTLAQFTAVVIVIVGTLFVAWWWKPDEAAAVTVPEFLRKRGENGEREK